MPGVSVKSLLANLRKAREAAGISEAELEERLIIGPGWISRFESANPSPSLEMLTAILGEIGGSLGQLDHEASIPSGPLQTRTMFTEEEGDDLLIHFPYAAFDAVFRLSNATQAEYDAVIKVLRDQLARTSNTEAEDGQAIKAGAVATAYLEAVHLWPDANPSDLWWFVIYRAFCDRFNHPAMFARLDLGQSWKRTGGWALEQVMVSHYAPFLQEHGVRLFIADKFEKERLLGEASVSDRMEPDKADVLLTGNDGQSERFFGVVHVKASFAERRTDDVPMSRALVEAGYVSPLWTMDCKSMPSASPHNRGELGVPLDADTDKRSAKRKDVEDDGFFSSCFSYNTNTHETPETQDTEHRIYVCDFGDPDDAFSEHVLTGWERFRSA